MSQTPNQSGSARKRGRPSRSTPQSMSIHYPSEDNESQPSTPQSVQKKRGRPSKHAGNEFQTNSEPPPNPDQDPILKDKPNNPHVTPVRRYQPKNDTQIPTPVVSKLDSLTNKPKSTPDRKKRGPGRPPKQTDGNVVSEGELPPTATEQAEEEMFAHSNDQAQNKLTPGTKRRGRPPKQKVNEQADTEEVQSTISASELRDAESSVPSGDQTQNRLTPGTKRRGRPPKQKVNEQADTEEVPATPSTSVVSVVPTTSQTNLDTNQKGRLIRQQADNSSTDNQQVLTPTATGVRDQEVVTFNVQVHSPITSGGKIRCRQPKQKQTELKTYNEQKPSITLVMECEDCETSDQDPPTKDEPLTPQIPPGSRRHQRKCVTPVSMPTELSHDGQGIDQVTPYTKKRGKPLKQNAADRQDEHLDGSLTEVKPVGSAKRRQRPPKKAVQEETPDPVGVSTVCAHCANDFHTIKKLKKHMMLEHHRVWSEENPEGEHNMTGVLRGLGFITCLKCERAYTTLTGLCYHVNTCGREEEEVSCEECGKKMTLKKLAYHKKSTHKNLQKEQTEAVKDLDTDSVRDDNTESVKAEETSSTPGSGRLRRKAAQKAIHSLKVKLQGQDSDDDEDDNSSDQGDPDVKISDGQTESDDEDFMDDDVSSERDSDFFKSSGKKSEYVRMRTIRKGQTRLQEAEKEWPFYPEDRIDLSQSQIVENTLEWLQTHECSDLYPQWVPRKTDWEPCELLIDNSVCNGIIKSGEHGVADVGSIAWSSAWCPHPLDIDPTEESFLAVSCNKEIESQLSPTPTVTSCVQIWNCGQLEDKLTTLELSYTVVLDGSQIWSMKWCPTGAYHKLDTRDDTQIGSMKRLGLLAVATNAGYIHILSLPHPQNLLKTFQKKCFTVQPSLTLSLQPLATCLPCCLCLDWSIQDKCQRICAGFSNGCVALWSLNTPSTLQKTYNERSLAPFHIFKADLGACAAISFCPSNNNYLATGSVRKVVRIYRLGRPSPLQELQINRVTTVVWPLFWHSVCVGFDFLENNESNPALQLTVGIENFQRNLLKMKGCVWCIDHSPWLNALVACDSTGLISTLQQSSITGRGRDKDIYFKRYVWQLEDNKSLRKPQDDIGKVEILLSPMEDSLYTVAWSPNMHSRCWLACGGHSGKVHIKLATLYKA